MDEDEYMTKKNALELEILKQESLSIEINKKISVLKAEKTELENEYNLYKIRKKRDSGASEYAENEFEWSKDIKKLLNEKFKFKSFRYKQLAAINGTLSKRHVILVMPTGGGKSLVYQLPAIFCGHITLVISPLISLIDDQIRGLTEIGIRAASLNSTTEKDERNLVYEAMTDPNSNLRLLYVTPEWVVKSNIFKTKIQKCHKAGCLDRIVLDEVHCCSMWGHDFRQDYRLLSILKIMCQGVPILGLTATATMRTLIDIQESLDIDDCLIITAPFNRPNLYYKVIHKSPKKAESLNYLVHLILKKFHNMSGIIYTSTTSECDDISKVLTENHINASSYHAQLDTKIRKKVQEDWFQNKVQIIVATVAFGMGIDKSDVRFVIHNCIPKTLENYYQESGRAGRDHERAECILMYNLNDHLRNVAMTSTTKERALTNSILNYCLNMTSCRRELIANHFDDNWRQTDCDKMCDNCTKPKRISQYNVSSVLGDIIKIFNNSYKITLRKLMSAWYHEGNKKDRVSSVKPPKCSKTNAEIVVGHLLLKGHLNVHSVYNMYAPQPYIIQGNNIKQNPINITHLSGLKFPLAEATTQATNDIESESSEPVSKKLKK